MDVINAITYVLAILHSCEGDSTCHEVLKYYVECHTLVY